jgi:hypothetical protein
MDWKMYFNTFENKDVELPHLPDIKYYSPETMKPNEHKKFLSWYEQNKDTPFNLRRELHIYGENDTKILLGAIVEFRKLILMITKGIVIFTHLSIIYQDMMCSPSLQRLLQWLCAFLKQWIWKRDNLALFPN